MSFIALISLTLRGSALDKKNMDDQLKGYVHNVTLTSNSRKGSLRYFKFSLQESEGHKRRAVCYDPSKREVLKGYEESREAVRFLNVGKRKGAASPSEEEIVLTKRCRIESANKNDIQFEYEESESEEEEGRFVGIGTIGSLAENQVISVKGCLSMRAECIKEVTMKNGSTVPMLNRCTVTDQSGTIRLTLWRDTVRAVSNNNCYSIENVVIKKRDMATYLTTNQNTIIRPIQERFAAPSEEFFDSLFDIKRIFVDKISFAQNFKKWLSCCNCGRQLSDLTSISDRIVKCDRCNTVQPMSVCSVNGSVRIAVRNDKFELIWLKVFTPMLDEILSRPAPDVTLDSTEEEIYQQLFHLENITIEYNNSFVMKGAYFELI